MIDQSLGESHSQASDVAAVAAVDVHNDGQANWLVASVDDADYFEEAKYRKCKEKS